MTARLFVQRSYSILAVGKFKTTRTLQYGFRIISQLSAPKDSSFTIGGNA